MLEIYHLSSCIISVWICKALYLGSTYLFINRGTPLVNYQWHTETRQGMETWVEARENCMRPKLIYQALLLSFRQ